MGFISSLPAKLDAGLVEPCRRQCWRKEDTVNLGMAGSIRKPELAGPTNLRKGTARTEQARVSLINNESCQ